MRLCGDAYSGDVSPLLLEKQAVQNAGHSIQYGYTVACPGGKEAPGTAGIQNRR